MIENDLSKLADQIGVIRNGIENPRIGLTSNGYNVLDKAQRIIKELSKVDTEKITRFSSMAAGALFNLMAECNEIAAEGSDGR